MPNAGPAVPQQAQPETGDARRGIYDCDLAHRSPLDIDYERVFTSGMVALDTNVLLNLYRSNEHTRRDTLAALAKLRERLWVPHQVLTEFWRNREASNVRHHHSSKAKDAYGALDKSWNSAETAVSNWIRAVHLSDDEDVTQAAKGALQTLGTTLTELKQLIEGQAEKDAVHGTAETHTDPVLKALEPLLAGHVGDPLPPDDYDEAVKEAGRRAEHQIPPGYEDAGKASAEGAAGDYLLWVQLLREAKSRDCDVLLITADAKADWWTKRNADIPARPRRELINEMRQQAGTQLYMLTPGGLLTMAERLLDLEVDVGSVSDLERMQESDRVVETADGGWTADSLRVYINELTDRYPTQAAVVLNAAAREGFVDRDTVFELAGFPEGRKIPGFTRPLGTVSRELADSGYLTGEEPFLLRTIYDSAEAPSWATGFRVPDEVLPLLRTCFEESPLWPVGQEPDEKP